MNNWQQVNAAKIAKRSRDNLFASMHPNFSAADRADWAARAKSDQIAAAAEYAKARFEAGINTDVAA